MIDIDELERLEKAATPAPWVIYEPHGEYWQTHWSVGDSPVRDEAKIVFEVSGSAGEYKQVYVLWKIVITLSLSATLHLNLISAHP